MPEYTSRTYDEDRSLLTLQSIVAEDFRTAGGLRRRLLRTDAAQPPTRIEGSLVVRELFPHEFPHVEEEVWSHYRDRKVHPGGDRIFGALAGEYLVGTARCRKHPDGCEVDRVYVLSEYRGRGIDRQLMDLLVRECGERDILYLHSRTGLINFYASFGFSPISRRELPKTIRERFIFHTGEVEALGITPMKREPGSQAGELQRT
ncbi:GNAT family N-acetyltransferase [Methanoculleus chikugoensis]|nr:GNAT family N-acetyltransferase [Methanoculleus chikugoensis]